MTISENLRNDCGGIWEEIFERPFVRELYSGELPPGKFEFYVLQDYHYLVAAMKNFGLIASRADSVKELREVARILHLEATSEFEGYEELLKRLGRTVEDAAGTRPMEVTLSYGSFLIAVSSTRPFAESITSVLPCFWSYAEIASRHRGALASNSNQLYVDWAKVYFSDDYLSLVERMKKLVDEAGKGYPYDKLKRVFAEASVYESMFWDSVYKRGE